MIFIRDTRDKAGKHKEVDNYLVENGHKIVRSKMYVGDVAFLENQTVCIDLKYGLDEVYSNIIHDNKRFKDECIKAQEAGITLIILVADENIDDTEKVHTWKNKRREKWFFVHNAQKRGKMLYIKQAKIPPCSSEQLQKSMLTMAKRYGIQWKFCKRKDMGREIIKILLKGVIGNGKHKSSESGVIGNQTD